MVYQILLFYLVYHIIIYVYLPSYIYFSFPDILINIKLHNILHISRFESLCPLPRSGSNSERHKQYSRGDILKTMIILLFYGRQNFILSSALFLLNPVSAPGDLHSYVIFPTIVSSILACCWNILLIISTVGLSYSTRTFLAHYLLWVWEGSLTVVQVCIFHTPHINNIPILLIIVSILNYIIVLIR